MLRVSFTFPPETFIICSVIIRKEVGLLILYFDCGNKGNNYVLLWTNCAYKTELETLLSCSDVTHCIVHHCSAVLHVFWFVCIQSELAEPWSDNLCFEIIITYFELSFSWINSGEWMKTLPQLVRCQLLPLATQTCYSLTWCQCNVNTQASHPYSYNLTEGFNLGRAQVTSCPGWCRTWAGYLYIW